MSIPLSGSISRRIDCFYCNFKSIMKLFEFPSLIDYTNSFSRLNAVSILYLELCPFLKSYISSYFIVAVFLPELSMTLSVMALSVMNACRFAECLLYSYSVILSFGCLDLYLWFPYIIFDLSVKSSSVTGSTSTEVPFAEKVSYSNSEGNYF